MFFVKYVDVYTFISIILIRKMHIYRSASDNGCSNKQHNGAIGPKANVDLWEISIYLYINIVQCHQNAFILLPPFSHYDYPDIEK